MAQLKKINPAYRNLNSTDQSLSVPVLAGDVNTVIEEVNLQDLRIAALENAPSGSNSFVKLASVSNVDISDLGNTDFDFEDGITCENSAPSLVIITRANNTDTYNGNSDTQNCDIKLASSIIVTINPFAGAKFLANDTERQVSPATLSAPYDIDDVYKIDVTTVAGAQFIINVEIWGVKLS